MKKPFLFITHSLWENVNNPNHKTHLAYRDTLISALDQLGWGYFIDKDVSDSEVLKQELKNKLETCVAAVVLLNQKALGSDHVKWEMGIYQARHPPFKFRAIDLENCTKEIKATDPFFAPLTAPHIIRPLQEDELVKELMDWFGWNFACGNSFEGMLKRSICLYLKAWFGTSLRSANISQELGCTEAQAVEQLTNHLVNGGLGSLMAFHKKCPEYGTLDIKHFLILAHLLAPLWVPMSSVEPLHRAWACDHPIPGIFSINGKWAHFTGRCILRKGFGDCVHREDIQDLEQLKKWRAQSFGKMRELKDPPAAACISTRQKVFRLACDGTDDNFAILTRLARLIQFDLESDIFDGFIDKIGKDHCEDSQEILIKQIKKALKDEQFFILLDGSFRNDLTLLSVFKTNFPFFFLLFYGDDEPEEAWTEVATPLPRLCIKAEDTQYDHFIKICRTLVPGN